MAARRTHRRREAQLAFEALSIEGSLLSPEWLARAAALGAGGQSEAEYRVPRGLNLRDEIGRYWRIAQAHWNDLSAGRAGAADASALSERFVTAFLHDVLGFVSLASTAPIEIAGRSYPIGHLALGRRVPVVIAPAASGLETSSVAFGDGGRRRNAFGLAQEFLNASDDALWGVACDGVTLRILRDNASLTRPAWIEADIARIFVEELYADFAALWLLAHETRFGSADKPPTDCALETWRNAGRDEGTRALGKLRDGVRDALLALGQGFLAHADNDALRASLQDGSFTKEAYFQELLRLVYRVIFLLTVEERGVLHPDSATDAPKALYAAGYSLHRLRDRSVRRSAHDRFSDLWEALTIIFRGTARGEARIGLPALAGLFSESQCAKLEAQKLENRALLTAVFHLSWLREGTGLSRVNWRDMGPEELGGVYEGLLELVPQITEGGRRFAFATGGETAGNARKLTGSYYTPDSLVQVLLDSALEPVIADTIARNPENSVEALLGLSIVDPACGSGHFLLAAARRLASHVARLSANGTPSAPEYRHALREVVGHCIYGVDLNEMAVELCKVGLWMEAIEPGRPLSFLESHIQHGNALLGTTPDLMAKGVPDEAWEPIEGDDKRIASALKKQNKRERAELSLEFTPSPASTYVRLGAGARAVDETPDQDLAALESKGRGWQDLVASSAYTNARFAADLWCAAFVWPKVPGTLRDLAPTEAGFRAAQKDPARVSSELRIEVDRLRHAFQFFHWHLAFPQVLARGGFDVVLGNPPWDTLSPDAKEFFSQFDPSVRTLAPADVEALVQSLCEEPSIAAAWQTHRRQLYGAVHFMKGSGRFVLFAVGHLGKGDFNVYRMFVEAALSLTRTGGSAAQIVPDGLYGGGNCAAIRRELLEHCEVRVLFGFENTREAWFAGIHSAAKFAIYAVTRGSHTNTFRAAFNIRSLEELRAATSTAALSIPVATVREFSPDALAVMEFRSQRDIDIARKMYGRWPPLGARIPGQPYREFLRELETGHVQAVLTEDAKALPHFEGRMIDQYDYRAKGYRSGRARAAVWADLPFGSSEKSIQPQWYVPREKIPEQAMKRIDRYRVGFCDVGSPTNERTLVAAMIPPHCVAGDKVPTVLMQSERPTADLLIWLAAANSFTMDFLVRMKVSLKLAITILDSLPFPRPALAHPLAKVLIEAALRLSCTGPEMDGLPKELALEGWAMEVGPGATWPGAIDLDQRLALVAEIEAAVATLYGLTADDLDYILETFPIVRRREQERFGEFRTKRLVLEAYVSRARSGDRRAPPGIARESRIQDAAEGGPQRPERAT